MKFYMFILIPTISLNSPHGGESNSLLVECLGLSKKQVMMMSKNYGSFAFFFYLIFLFLVLLGYAEL